LLNFDTLNSTWAFDESPSAAHADSQGDPEQDVATF